MGFISNATFYWTKANRTETTFYQCQAISKLIFNDHATKHILASI